MNPAVNQQGQVPPPQQGQLPPQQQQLPQGQQGNQEPPETRNLMVNYIPTTIDEVQLRQLFEMYGPIESVKIVCDRETRTSKGYGFVKYRFAFSATHAIQYLNGYPLLNKRLKVAYAAPMEANKLLAQQGGPVAPGMNPQQQAALQQQIAAMQQQQLQQPPQHQQAPQQVQQVPQQVPQQAPQQQGANGAGNGNGKRF